MEGHNDLSPPRKSRFEKRGKQIFPVVLRAKMIARILDCCERSAYYWKTKARDAAGKRKGQFITVKDFCLVTGIAESIVLEFFKR